MSQPSLFEPTEAEAVTAEREAEPDTKARGDDPTPRLVIRAVFAALFRFYFHVRRANFVSGTLEVYGVGDVEISEAHPYRVYDCCAGYGAWASEFAWAWVHVLGLPRTWLHITGVEIHEPRRDHLEKWCDEAVMLDWRRGLHGQYIRGGFFDLAIGNPDFRLLTAEDVEESMPAVLLLHVPAVLLLHTNNALQRGPEGRAIARAYPPERSWRIPGTVSFDGTSKSASDCYTASLFLRGHDGPTTSRLLDVEAIDENRAAGILKRNGEPYSCWRWAMDADRTPIAPGSEMPSEDLPGAPGWRK